MEMRLRTPVTRGYFFLLGALRLVNAASPRTISIDKKKISSGTQGNCGLDDWLERPKLRDLLNIALWIRVPVITFQIDYNLRNIP